MITLNTNQIPSSKKNHALYVLTDWSDGWYAALTAVSAWSLRLHNPDASITVLCDTRTKEQSHRAFEQLNEIVDEWVVVPVTAETQVEQSRILKVGMRHAVAGDFLFLDADTINVAPISLAMPPEIGIAAVPDLHIGTGTLTPPPSVAQLAAQLDQPLPAHYVNSGVMFWRDTAEMRALADRWQHFWHTCRELTGNHIDQPSLAVALNECEHAFSYLPAEYNCLVLNQENYLRDAVVLHFFASCTGRTCPSVPADLARMVRDHGAIDRERYEHMRKSRLIWSEGIRWELSQKRYIRAGRKAISRLLSPFRYRGNPAKSTNR